MCMCVYLYVIMYMTLVFCINSRKWYSEQIAVFLVIIFLEEENSRPMESSNFELHFPKHWSPFEFPFSSNGGILKSSCLSGCISWIFHIRHVTTPGLSYEQYFPMFQERLDLRSYPYEYW